MKRLVPTLLAAALCLGTPALAQTGSASPDGDQSLAELQAIQAEVTANKREFIARQMFLTEKEAPKFWPVFDDHQEALAKLNRRRLENITEYARVWNQPTTDNDAITALAEEALSIERDEAALLERTFRRLKGALPAAKAARYVQVESKLRAIVRFELAAKIPLAH